MEPNAQQGLPPADSGSGEGLVPAGNSGGESVEVMRLRSERALTTFADPFESAASYRHFMEVARTFAGSIFVPEHFKGKPGDCLVALNLAKRMDEDPLQVMQNIFVVKGRPGFYTSFMIARANRRGGLRSKIRWDEVTLEPAVVEHKGVKFPNVEVTAYAIDQFGDRIEAAVSTAMAVAEDWVSNSKYRTMCIHMLRWRAAAFLIRQYMPEVMMGFSTVEEAETMPASPAQIAVVDILPPAQPESSAPAAQTASAEPPVEREPGGDDEEPAGLFDPPAGKGGKR